MKEGPQFDRRYPPVGKCIYCGSDGAPDGLSDEHIIPYSLAGRAILENASCRRCSVITAKIEQHCAHEMFGHLRISQKLPTRRKKERPGSAPANFVFSDRTEEHLIAFDKHPANTLFPVFPMPSLMEWGMNEGVAVLGYRAFHDATAVENLQKWIPGQNLVEVNFAPPKIDPIQLVRMLAKIAHSFAVAKFGLNGFTPFLQNIILEDGAPWRPYVGGSFDYQRDTAQFHRIIAGRIQAPTCTWLFVKIRLFAQLGGPNECPPFYWVIVGSLTPAQEIDLVSSIERDETAHARDR